MERRMANELQNLTADGVPVHPGDGVFEVCPDGTKARRVIRDGGIIVAVDLDAWDLRSAESGLCDISKCYWSKEEAEAEFGRRYGKCGTGNKTPDPAAESVREVVGFAARDLKAGERIAIAVYPDRLRSCAIDFRLPDTQTPSNVTADGVRVYPGDVVWEPWPRGSRPYEVRTFDGLYFDAVRDDAVNGVELADIADCYSTVTEADAAEANRPRAAAR